MSKQSAGILMHRTTLDGQVEVLLVHPGGPLWVGKDAGAWSIPKGEMEPGEDAASVARREFAEETGFELRGRLRRLDPVRQRGGKTVHAFAVRGDLDAGAIRSNTFTMEWPPRSGVRRTFPEIDRAAWFALAAAKTRLNAAQVGLIDQLCALLEIPPVDPCGRDASAPQP